MTPSLHARLDNLAWSAATVVFVALGSLALGQLARHLGRWRGLSVGEQRKLFWGYLLASPWILGFVIFVVGPALASLYYSFTDYRLGKELHWIGLENYRVLLEGLGAHGRRFAQAMYNSFYYALVGVPLQIATALAMALLLSRDLRGMRVFRLVFYMPVILAGGPAILLAWRYMLAANGGFVNISLQRLAESFFLFDWLYRGFIFVVEGFNGFYAGIAHGDPVGPLVYTLPALIGVFAVLTLFGEWSAAKRTRAYRLAEIIGALLALTLLARAVVAEPVPPALIFAAGLAASLAVLALLGRSPGRRAQLAHGGFLALFAAMLVLAVLFGGDQRLRYGLAAVLAALPLVASLMVRRSRRTVLMAGAAALGALVFVGLVPGQLDGGRLLVFLRYTFLQSALAQPADLGYLQEGFGAAAPSGLWLAGLVVLALLGMALFGGRLSARGRRTMLAVLLAFFSLQALGSLLDGLRYFRAFEVLAQAAGSPNYHFALFHQVIAQLPDADRVPLWMRSELWSKPSLILITMWSSGAGMLIFLAALKGVPGVFYEAAKVDGANTLQRFFRITLPMISPAMFYNVVIGMIAALQTFEAVYIIQNPQTQDSLASAAYFLFVRTFRQLEIGQGAAASWILAVIIVLLTAFQFRYSNWVHYEG